MPKDPARNQPNYKIGGDHLNEYEFNISKGEMTNQEKDEYPRPKPNTEDPQMQDNAGASPTTAGSDQSDEKSNARSNS
jgi:hypothetical protein